MGLEAFTYFFDNGSPDAFLRCFNAFVGGTAGRSAAVSWHLLPSQPSRVGINPCPRKSKSPWLHVENYCIGMQQWCRGLLNLVDNPLGATGFESRSACDRYFERD